MGTEEMFSGSESSFWDGLADVIEAGTKGAAEILNALRGRGTTGGGVVIQPPQGGILGQIGVLEIAAIAAVLIFALRSR